MRLGGRRPQLSAGASSAVPGRRRQVGAIRRLPTHRTSALLADNHMLAGPEGRAGAAQGAGRGGRRCACTVVRCAVVAACARRRPRLPGAQARQSRRLPRATRRSCAPTSSWRWTSRTGGMARAAVRHSVAQRAGRAARWRAALARLPAREPAAQAAARHTRVHRAASCKRSSPRHHAPCPHPTHRRHCRAQ